LWLPLKTKKINQIDHDLLCELVKKSDADTGAQKLDSSVWDIVDAHRVCSLPTSAPPGPKISCAPQKLAAHLATVLEYEAKSAMPSMSFSKRHAMMTVLTAGYYGAVYNIVDMGRNIVHNSHSIYLATVCTALGISLVLALSYASAARSERTVSRLESLPVVDKCSSKVKKNGSERPVCETGQEESVRCKELDETKPCAIEVREKSNDEMTLLETSSPIYLRLDKTGVRNFRIDIWLHIDS
jgi:hypothetical protein